VNCCDIFSSDLPITGRSKLFGVVLILFWFRDCLQVVLKTVGGRDANITTPQARQLLEAQVLKGLLLGRQEPGQGQGQRVDLISAPAFAREAGLHSVCYLLCL
jgi:hypothetical protein